MPCKLVDGLRCLVVDRIAGSRTMSVLSTPGSRLPLHATSVGKVLLAFGSSELQEAVLKSLDRYTDTTITDARTLRTQIATIKAQGFAKTHEELEAGATSIAVPLRGKGGRVIAALGIVAPSDNGRDVSRMLPVLHVTAQALSKKLAESGY
jgi:DNA-binding IclR family transcriptional regulator